MSPIGRVFRDVIEVRSEKKTKRRNTVKTIFGKHLVHRIFTLNFNNQIDKPPKHGQKSTEPEVKDQL